MGSTYSRANMVGLPALQTKGTHNFRCQPFMQTSGAQQRSARQMLILTSMRQRLTSRVPKRQTYGYFWDIHLQASETPSCIRSIKTQVLHLKITEMFETPAGIRTIKAQRFKAQVSVTRCKLGFVLRINLPLRLSGGMGLCILFVFL